jgi:hypothetical protein
MNKYGFWFLICMIICFTLAFCVILIVNNDWHYTLRFQMDNNTLEAVKSINWSALPK